MKLLKRILVSLLILLTFNLCLPNMPLADQDLTEQPQIRSTPEEDIPTIKKKTSGWKWVISVGLVAALLYALGGGGGDDGEVTGTW